MSAFLLKAVFHVHTIWSRDGSLKPHDLIERSIDQGIDVLAVTDHNEIAGAHEVLKYAPFQVVVGEEIRTREGGEIIGLFLTKLIPKGIPAIEVIKDIKSQGGLVYLPHPFGYFQSRCFSKELLVKIAPSLDIVETFNARTILDSANAKALQYAERYKKISCAGADVHLSIELGRTFVELPPFSSPQELTHSLQHSRQTKVRSPYWVHGMSLWQSLKKFF